MNPDVFIQLLEETQAHGRNLMFAGEICFYVAAFMLFLLLLGLAVAHMHFKKQDSSILGVGFSIVGGVGLIACCLAGGICLYEGSQKVNMPIQEVSQSFMWKTHIEANRQQLYADQLRVEQEMIQSILDDASHRLPSSGD